MKQFFSIFGLSVLLLQPLPSAAEQLRHDFKTKVKFDRIYFNGIKYHMVDRMVFQKLGKPQSSREVQLCYGIVKRLSYPGMTVDLQIDHQGTFVSGIEVTRQNVGIDGVVKVGDPISKAKKAYGSEFFLAKNNQQNQWYARPRYSKLSLGFATNKAGTIAKIEIFADC